MDEHEYNIQLSLKVDPSANFLEVNSDTALDVLAEVIRMALYEIDDVTVEWIEVENADS